MRRYRFSAFNTFNIILLALISLMTVYPFWYVITASLTSDDRASQLVYYLWPMRPSLSAYRMVFSTNSIVTTYKNTIFVTVIGTFLSLIITALTAYPLSKRRLHGAKVLTGLFYFTMLFSGGLVPTFLVVRGLHLYNTLWALIWPKVVLVYNLLLMISFFKSIPDSLEESAALDGANDILILIRIIFPVSQPIFATMTLFYAVNYWNSWFDAVLYLSRSILYPLQLVLRNIVQNVDLSYVGGGGNDLTMTNLTMQSVRMATIIVAILPIMCVYPFLQKYFVKGVMIGAIKS
ncbi:MAG: carbohydrate ABC transporter permease [Treponema sp.]|jgi:putative aldouronate transport system permease protein|nr:carbohydrate ABC transporter permease [Treponema sp.]